MPSGPLLISCRLCGAPPGRHTQLLATRVFHKGRFLGRPLRVVCCGGCGLVFLNPQYTDAQYHSFYSDQYYQENWPSSPEGMARFRALLDSEAAYFLDQLQEGGGTLAQLAGSGPLSLLDVGSGFGAVLEYVQKHALGLRLHALEPGQTAASYLRRQYGAEVREESLDHSTYEDGRFDVLTAFNLIEHLTDPRRGTLSFNRLLRPDGLLVLTTPNLDPRSLRRGPTWFKVVHTFYFTEESLRRLVEAAGFSVIRSRIVSPPWCAYNSIVLLARKTGRPREEVPAFFPNGAPNAAELIRGSLATNPLRWLRHSSPCLLFEVLVRLLLGKVRA